MSAQRSGVDRDPAVLQREIEQTRLALGDTAAQLAAKADVKAQARERVAGIKAKITRKRSEVVTTVNDKTPDSARGGAAKAKDAAAQHPVPVAAVAALAAGFVLGRLVARRG